MHVSSDEEEDPESMFRVATVPESKNLAVRCSRNSCSRKHFDKCMCTNLCVCVCSQTITAGHCKNVLVQRRISKERLLTFTDGERLFFLFFCRRCATCFETQHR